MGLLESLNFIASQLLNVEKLEGSRETNVYGIVKGAVRIISLLAQGHASTEDEANNGDGTTGH